MQEIRRLSVGGENINESYHYQVGSPIGKSKYNIHRIVKDGKLFQEKGLSEYLLFAINTETQEIFPWYRVSIGTSQNHFEQFNLEFE